MKYRRLGSSDIYMSEIGLGGEYLIGLPDDVVKSIFDVAIANGINVMDLYPPQPGVRDAVGKALEGRRDKIQVQGHIGVTTEDGQYARTRDLALAKESFEDLMCRLHTDYIDFGMIHYCDDFPDYEVVVKNGLFDYALELKSKNIIKKIGMSTHNPKIALRAIEDGYLDMLLFSINPAWDIETASEDIDELRDFGAMHNEQHGMDADRKRLYETCEAKGIGITVMKAYGGGRLLSSEYTPFDRPLTPVQCISYALSRPGVLSVLPGVTSPEQLEEALAYVNASAEEKDYSFIATSPQYGLAGKCMYCNHCLPCSVGIDIGMVTKLLDLATSETGISETIADHYKALQMHASDCLSCGQCETNCPFSVQIIENMTKASELFGY